MWVRGLKLFILVIIYRKKIVAPRVGAWIETHELNGERLSLRIVAPRVGAWIETKLRLIRFAEYMGRTPCGCVD